MNNAPQCYITKILKTTLHCSSHKTTFYFYFFLTCLAIKIINQLLICNCLLFRVY